MAYTKVEYGAVFLFFWAQVETDIKPSDAERCSQSQAHPERITQVGQDPGRTFLDLIGLWHGLEDLLGVKVDIIDQG